MPPEDIWNTCQGFGILVVQAMEVSMPVTGLKGRWMITGEG
jgi:hypothetical protein